MVQLNVSCKVSGVSPDTPDTLHDTLNWTIILQYFTILNYELFCKRNGIPLVAHFIYT